MPDPYERLSHLLQEGGYDLGDCTGSVVPASSGVIGVLQPAGRTLFFGRKHTHLGNIWLDNSFHDAHLFSRWVVQADGEHLSTLCDIVRPLAEEYKITVETIALSSK